MKRQESHDIRNFELGISRKLNKNKEYEYFYIKSKKPISKQDLKRIKDLKIPPIWTNVWISTDKLSKIQVIGVDIKGRKQYLYHTTHIQNAETKKFLRMYDFIKSIPKLEKSINNDTKLDPYDLNRVISTMLKLVKLLHIRVGKEQYARHNKSYGISSLKKSHLKIEGDTIKLRFKGKSNQKLSYSLYSPDIRKHLSYLLKLDGVKLFQYIKNSKVRRVTDTDLNRYIKHSMGSKKFSIKDFRTYAANNLFIAALLNETKKRKPKNERTIKKNIMNALKTTAHYLRHTKAISKKSYIMNFCVELYQKNPEYFISRKYDNPNDILLDLLEIYTKEIIKKK